MKILITGYPYVRESFFKTFDGMKEECLFLLPRRWKAKGGRVVFTAPKHPNVITARAFFYHSNYPIVGGVFKGLMPKFFFVLWRHRKEVDVVYSPTEPILLSTLYQGICTKFFGKKHVIFTWENVSYTKFKGFNGVIKKLILKANLKLCDGVVCGNHKAQEIISDYFRGKTEVIPLSGIDTDFFKPIEREQAKHELGCADKTMFSFIGAIDYRKGIHVMLSALKEVLASLPNAFLIIAGSGEYETQVKKLIHDLGLEQSVRIYPWIDHAMALKILGASDAFLYPSVSHGGWEEQFGYSIAEAMLMELPVISTRSGSIDELIKDGKTGILTEPQNSQQLAQSMLLLARDGAKRHELGREARTAIIERYSLSVIGKRYQTFFQSL